MVTPATKQELIKKDTMHLLHPFSAVGAAPRVIWKRGQGTKLWDINAKQYTDMSSGGVQMANLGFGRSELNDAACEQIKELGHIFIGIPMSTAMAIEYAAELAKVLPGDINHIYFTNTGTESIEVAIQIARLFWEAKGRLDKYKIVSLTHAYHGGSVLSRSLSNIGMSCFGQPYPGIVRIGNYHCHLCPYGLKYPTCNVLCARVLESVIEDEGEDTVAAFVAEPVQGAAGVIWPPDEYWRIVRKICSDHDILLIDDEVMAGFCRTTRMFAIEQWDVVPDIMTMAKGINSAYLPFGAVGFSDRVHDTISGDRFRGVSSSSANPVCVATARAALKVYTEQNLAERAAKLGELIHQRLVNEFLPLPCVDDIMGKGLFQSFEIALNKTTGKPFNLEATTKAREKIFSRCLEKGIFINRVDGYPRRQPISPACVITEEELDGALNVMLSVMKQVEPV